MGDLPLLEIEQLIEGIESSDSFLNDLLVADLNGIRVDYEKSDLKDTTPMRMDALLMILVQEGSAEISIDYVPYQIEPNMFIILMPTHVVQISRIGKDLRGCMLTVSRSFFDGYDPGAKKNPPVAHYMRVRKNPCTRLTEEESLHMLAQFRNVRDKVRAHDHFFQREALQNALVGLFIEFANISMGKGEMTARPTLSRKEELFEQFLQLLFQHCKEQHVVTFYAEKLFITPQYLSLILKELTGKSANKWIDDALIMEAKILLKAPQATVQQVADLLHFSDQSTFGKFFKKHMGISPMEYRKS